MRTIAHISDLHFGREQPEVAEGLARDLREHPADLLVASGDFTQRARRRQYAAAAGYMRRLPSPQILVPGNHDIPLYDVVRRFFSPLTRYRHYLTADLSPFYQDPELAILGINSARSFIWSLGGFWKDGSLSGEQLREIERRFESVPDSTFKILVTHHPFIPPPGQRLHGMIGGAHRALEILERCGVDMLLAGHLHLTYSGDVRTHYEATSRSILSIQAGSAISDRLRHQANSYNRITIDGAQVTIAVRTWSGQAFADGEITRYIRADGVWQRQA